MALKDWKKVGHFYWKNKRGDMLRIDKYDVDYSSGVPVKHNKFEVKYGSYHPYLIQLKLLGTFKTNAKALRFARSYMRSH